MLVRDTRVGEIKIPVIYGGDGEEEAARRRRPTGNRISWIMSALMVFSFEQHLGKTFLRACIVNVTKCNF